MKTNKLLLTAALGFVMPMCVTSSLAQSVPSPNGDICFEGSARRWSNQIANSRIAVDFSFTSAAAPDSGFNGQFFINYTGVAPNLSINPPFDLSFSYAPNETSVSLSAAELAPDTLLIDKVEYDLCHICYDFAVTILNAEGLVVQVYSSDSKDPLVPNEKNWYSGGSGTINWILVDGKGNPVSEKELERVEIQVDFANFEACYCIPEPSTALLGLGSIGFLLIRRKR